MYQPIRVWFKHILQEYPACCKIQLTRIEICRLASSTFGIFLSTEMLMLPTSTTLSYEKRFRVSFWNVHQRCQGSLECTLSPVWTRIPALTCWVSAKLDGRTLEDISFLLQQLLLYTSLLAVDVNLPQGVLLWLGILTVYWMQVFVPKHHIIQCYEGFRYREEGCFLWAITCSWP